MLSLSKFRRRRCRYVGRRRRREVCVIRKGLSICVYGASCERRSYLPGKNRAVRGTGGRGPVVTHRKDHLVDACNVAHAVRAVFQREMEHVAILYDNK